MLGAGGAAGSPSPLLGGPLDSGGLEEGLGALEEGLAGSRLCGLGAFREAPRGSAAEMKGSVCCAPEDQSGPSPTSTMTPSCSSLSAKSPASPEQCSREGVEAFCGGALGGSTEPLLGEEGPRKARGPSNKRPRPPSALSRELISLPTGSGAGGNKNSFAASGPETRLSNNDLLELGLNAEILQSLLNKGVTSGDGLPLGSEGAPKEAEASRGGTSWGLLAPAAPVTPTTSNTRGGPQAGEEESLMLRKQQKLQAAALLPLDMLQQLGAGLPAIEETQEQQQDTLKLLRAAAASKLPRGCSAEELSRMLEGVPVKSECVRPKEQETESAAKDRTAAEGARS